MLEFIIQIAIIIVVLLFSIIFIIIKIKNRTKKNELSFYRRTTSSDGYGGKNIKFRKRRIVKIVDKFKKMRTKRGGVSIESKFNGIYYALFDLDTKSNIELFKELYKSTPYVLFRSSQDESSEQLYVHIPQGPQGGWTNGQWGTSGPQGVQGIQGVQSSHFWGIVDIPFKKRKDIFYEHNWKICNDDRYTLFCRNFNKIFIRGLYDSKDKKPILWKVNGELSENFKLFIDTLEKYYNNEGLEISVLRYQNHEMLFKFNRKRKLELLNKKSNDTKNLNYFQKE